MNADSTYHFDGEDHTLGVLLQRELLKKSEVSYAAYKIPHPLTRSVEIRVQTMGIPSREIVDRALESALEQVDEVDTAFDNAIKEWNVDN